MLDNFVRGGEHELRTRGMIVSRLVYQVYGMAPARQSHGMLIAVSGGGHTRKQINEFVGVIHMQKKSISKAVLSGMQLTLHATRRTPRGSSRLVRAMSLWSVKTRRVRPGIVGMRRVLWLYD